MDEMQPSTDDPLATMISDLSHTGELSMLYRMEVADAITQLRLELAQARECEAGAYEAAAGICDKHSYSNNLYVSMRVATAAREIRALTPADTMAALAARDARVRDATSDKMIAAIWAHYGDLKSAKAAILALRTPTEGTPE